MKCYDIYDTLNVFTTTKGAQKKNILKIKKIFLRSSQQSESKAKHTKVGKKIINHMRIDGSGRAVGNRIS